MENFLSVYKMSTVAIPSTIQFRNLTPERLRIFVQQLHRCGVYPNINQAYVDQIQNLITRYTTWEELQWEYPGYPTLVSNNLVSAYRALYNA